MIEVSPKQTPSIASLVTDAAIDHYYSQPGALADRLNSWLEGEKLRQQRLPRRGARPSLSMQLE